MSLILTIRFVFPNHPPSSQQQRKVTLATDLSSLSRVEAPIMRPQKCNVCFHVQNKVAQTSLSHLTSAWTNLAPGVFTPAQGAKVNTYKYPHIHTTYFQALKKWKHHFHNSRLSKCSFIAGLLREAYIPPDLNINSTRAHFRASQGPRCVVYKYLHSGGCRRSHRI